VSFDDDGIFDQEEDVEDPESPIRASERQQQTPRRGNHSNMVHDSDNENVPRARSKGKAKATTDDHDGADIEEEIVQGLEDVDMQQDEDDEVTPKKRPKEKKPRKKRALLEVPCKSPLAVAQPSN
jgi:hypothetical protein